LKSTRINTSGSKDLNSSRINTSGTKDLKSCRINTSKKQGRGVGSTYKVNEVARTIPVAFSMCRTYPAPAFTMNPPRRRCMDRRSRTDGKSAPEGRQILAQGVSPGYRPPIYFYQMFFRAPEGRHKV
jgi:hypothetical protein